MQEINQSLVEKQKTIDFPKKTLDVVCFLTTKQKESVFIVRIELKTKPDYRCQTVYALADSYSQQQGKSFLTRLHHSSWTNTSRIVRMISAEVWL